MTIYGWDASDFDWDRGPMNMVSARNAGIDFFTHKATEGTRTIHFKYGEALNRARAAGIPVLGAYIVPRTPGNGGHGSVTSQVDYFLNRVESQTPWWREHPYWMWQVDTEWWSSNGVYYDKVSPEIGAEVCRQLRERTGRFVVHYAPYWCYKQTVPNVAPLWSSAYPSHSTLSPQIIYPTVGGDSGSGWIAYSGQVPMIWQFSATSTIGVQPRCDANAFRGTIEQLKTIVSGGAHVAEDFTEANKLDISNSAWEWFHTIDGKNMRDALAEIYGIMADLDN